MSRRIPLFIAAGLLGAITTHAQDTMKDWLARILDPATVGLTAPEGATLNRKISVDTIHYDRDHPTKKIAVYMMPVDKMAAATTHFATALGIPAQSGTDSKGIEKHFFDCNGAAKCPAKAKGLTIAIGRSPWVDGMAQIQLELPGSTP
jgi:hypothetical protein